MTSRKLRGQNETPDQIAVRLFVLHLERYGCASLVNVPAGQFGQKKGYVGFDTGQRIAEERSS